MAHLFRIQFCAYFIKENYFAGQIIPQELEGNIALQDGQRKRQTYPSVMSFEGCWDWSGKEDLQQIVHPFQS